MFEHFEPQEVVFASTLGYGGLKKFKEVSPLNRLKGCYFIDAHALKIIKTGLNCLKYRRTTSDAIEADDIQFLLDLVSKEYDDLTE
jgi:hypothetical protein